MTDPTATVYGQLVNLIKGEPTLYDPRKLQKGLIWPSNLITYAGPQPWQEKKNKGDADYPELDLDEGNFADSGFTQWVTFGTQAMGAGGTACNWKEQVSLVYVATITTRDYQLPPGTQIRTALLLALRKSGPRLGLPSLVKSWGPVTCGPPAKSSTVTAAGTFRRVLKVNIPVTIIYDGNAIVS